MVSPMPVHSLPRDAFGAAKTRGGTLGMPLIVQRRLREEGDALRNVLAVERVLFDECPFLAKEQCFFFKGHKDSPIK